MNLTRAAPATETAALAGYPRCWTDFYGTSSDWQPVTEVDWHSEHFTYRSIWYAADVLRQAGEKDEPYGFWSLLAATVLAYTSYEGFLNYMIECLYPQVWKQERSFFLPTL